MYRTLRRALLAFSAMMLLLVSTVITAPAAQAWTMTASSPIVAAGNTVVAARTPLTLWADRWEGQCTSASGRYWGKVTVVTSRSDRSDHQWDVGSVTAVTGDNVTGHSGNAYVVLVGTRFGRNGIEGGAQGATADLADNEENLAFQGTVGAPDPFSGTVSGTFDGRWVLANTGPAVPGVTKDWYFYTYRVTFVNKHVLASDQSNVCSVYLNYGSPGLNGTQTQRAEPSVPAPTRNVYRAYKSAGSDYLLGLTKGEGAASGYVYQKVAFKVWASPLAQDSKPLYRCRYSGGHFLSNSSTCDGHTVEGLLGYVLSKEYSNSRPVYRCYRATALVHLSTTNFQDCVSSIVATDPWKIEAVQGYVRP
jgi:hypothetical protein